MPDTSQRTPEERARKRTDERSSVIWHTWAYIVVNAFLWFLDIVTGGGVQWAYWTTIPWGVGLVFHHVAYRVDGSGQERAYQRFLAEERERDRAQRQPQP